MEDLIRRAEAIEAVEHITSSMSVCVNTDECHGMKRMQRQAVTELTNMPPAQQWIPCSDRPPEEEVEVFVYLFDRPSPYIAWISKGGKWHTEDFTLEADDNPVAWMPLPEPYKGEQP